MLSPDMAAGLPGTTLTDAAGQVLGPIDEVFLNTGDDTPAWAAVMVEGRRAIVPLLRAEHEGDTVRAGFAREQVLGAPAVDAAAIDSDVQEQLYAHYGISDAEMRDDSGWSADREPTREQGTSRDPAAGSGNPDRTVGHP